MRPSRPAFFAVATACLVAACAIPVRGDTYPRQAGVDAQHYRFDLTLSDASDEFVGETTAVVLFTQEGVGEVAFDLMSVANGRGMKVGSVKAAAGTAAPAAVKFTHENSRVVIPLSPAPKAGEKMQFVMSYRGLPGPGMHIGPNRNGERTFFSENWPDRARQWVPCIDHPSDKATTEFIVTAPSKYQVVANGLLAEEVKNADGTTRTHWKQSVPNATWLNAIGVANFAMHKGEPVLGIPLQTWVFPQQADLTAGIEDSAKKSLEFYSEYVGPYPYEKLANVQAMGISGGTEHSSAIFYGERSVGPGGPLRLVAHEIAHQWFGCSVTEKDWDDVWLSEGFATYFTLMCVEKLQGKEAFIAGVKQSRTNIFATQRRMPNQPVIHANLDNMRNVLNQLVYQKGGFFLHMLRGEVGDAAFQAGIRSYYKKYRDQNASTDDLRAEMEAASGKKLEWMFTQWLKRPGSPTVEGTWSYDAAQKKVIVQLSQTQAAEAFRLPLEIGIADDGGAARVVKIEMTEKAQRFEIDAEKEPAAATLDPNTWVLMDSKFGKQ